MREPRTSTSWVTAEGFTPGRAGDDPAAIVRSEVVHLQTTEADRKGRVPPPRHDAAAVAAGDADVVGPGRAGDDELIRMLPLQVARGHHHHGGRADGTAAQQRVRLTRFR